MNIETQFHGVSEQDITIRGVSCLGQCDHAPAISINDHIFTSATEANVEQIIRGVLTHGEMPESSTANRERVQCASDPYGESGAEHYSAVHRLVASRDWDSALAALKSSGLRGLGGAGFPTESKWQIVRQAADPEKYIVCNADESEPGTFKDRFILTHLPASGDRRNYSRRANHRRAQGHPLYSPRVRSPGKAAASRKFIIAAAKAFSAPTFWAANLSFDLEIFVSPGGYICGEESALLEAIEGKRAEPRNKPPFPVQQGLWNKPTVINNVETFAHVPQILVRGVDWYKSQGANGNAGLKFIGVSGDVVRPGVYEIPMGTSMSDLIFNHAGGIVGGKKLKAFAPSGPSSGYLPASMADVHIDFKSLADAGSMLGSGAVVVCAEPACMLDMALERDAILSATNPAENACPAASGRRKWSTSSRAGRRDTARPATWRSSMNSRKLCASRRSAAWDRWCPLRSLRS